MMSLPSRLEMPLRRAATHNADPKHEEQKRQTGGRHDLRHGSEIVFMALVMAPARNNFLVHIPWETHTMADQLWGPGNGRQVAHLTFPLVCDLERRHDASSQHAPSAQWKTDGLQRALRSWPQSIHKVAQTSPCTTPCGFQIRALCELAIRLHSCICTRACTM